MGMKETTPRWYSPILSVYKIRYSHISNWMTSRGLELTRKTIRKMANECLGGRESLQIHFCKSPDCKWNDDYFHHFWYSGIKKIKCIIGHDNYSPFSPVPLYKIIALGSNCLDITVSIQIIFASGIQGQMGRILCYSFPESYHAVKLIKIKKIPWIKIEGIPLWFRGM